MPAIPHLPTAMLLARPLARLAAVAAAKAGGLALASQHGACSATT